MSKVMVTLGSKPVSSSGSVKPSNVRLSAPAGEAQAKSASESSSFGSERT